MRSRSSRAPYRVPGAALIRHGLASGIAAVTQLPGREAERACAGDGRERGDRGEQRGGHSDQADPDDRYRDAEVDAYVKGRADFGALLGRAMRVSSSCAARKATPWPASARIAPMTSRAVLCAGDARTRASRPAVSRTSPAAWACAGGAPCRTTSWAAQELTSTSAAIRASSARFWRMEHELAGVGGHHRQEQPGDHRPHRRRGQADPGERATDLLRHARVLDAQRSALPPGGLGHERQRRGQPARR